MVGEASKNFTVEVEDNLLIVIFIIFSFIHIIYHCYPYYQVEDEATEPPNFSHAPMNRTVREGDSATFDCRVTSYSRPHIKWLKKVEAMDTGFNLSEVILVGASRQPIILIIAIIIMIIMIITMIIMIITIIITMIIMIIIGDPCGCGQVPTDPQQQRDPHHLGGRDSKSAAVKVPFLTIIKKPAPF